MHNADLQNNLAYNSEFKHQHIRNKMYPVVSQTDIPTKTIISLGKSVKSLVYRNQLILCEIPIVERGQTNII